MNEINELLTLHEQEFKNLLSTKTGWGRNEIMIKYKEATIATLTKMMSKEKKDEQA